MVSSLCLEWSEVGEYWGQEECFGCQFLLECEGTEVYVNAYDGVLNWYDNDITGETHGINKDKVELQSHDE